MELADEIVDMLNEYIFSVTPATPIAHNDAPRCDVADMIQGLLIGMCVDNGLPIEYD